MPAGTPTAAPATEASAQRANDLPTELIFRILRCIAPNRVLQPLGSVNFIVERAQFASLRLICSTWDQPVLNILLETTFLIANFVPKIMERNVKVFDHHAHLIKTVVVEECYMSRAVQPTAQDAKRVADNVGRGLSACTSVRELELGTGRYAFRNRRWCQKFCPQLSSTVTTLKFIAPRMAQLSLALVHLGRNITYLHLHGFYGDGTPSSFHLPFEMPQLTRLILYTAGAAEDPSPAIRKLLSRITANRRSPTSCTIPLRELTLAGRLTPSQISELLSVNDIGLHLTSFHSEYYPPHPLLPFSALTLCPSPQAFSLIAPYGIEIFSRLPEAIRPVESLEFQPDHSNHLIVLRKEPGSTHKILGVHFPGEKVCQFCDHADRMDRKEADDVMMSWITRCLNSGMVLLPSRLRWNAPAHITIPG